MADDAPDMLASAPRDGTLIRLWLREDGSDFVGYYSDKWLGWVSYHESVPLIRGDIRFLRWEPVDQRWSSLTHWCGRSSGARDRRRWFGWSGKPAAGGTRAEGIEKRPDDKDKMVDAIIALKIHEAVEKLRSELK
jgi:hypothetical protein